MAVVADSRVRSTGGGVEPHVPRNGWRVLAVLSVLLGFALISTDLFLPAIPTIATALTAAPGTIELTISSYLLGFSFGQLLWGPIGDRYGRRGPIAAGLLLFIMGSAGCALSGSASALIGWRILQALGACASVVLARAMVRDLHAGPRAAQMMSTLMAIMAVAPLLGPLVGGGILAVAGWRAIFGALVVIGLLTLVALFSLNETLPPAQRSTEPLRRSFAEYGGLLRDRRLLAYAGVGGFFFGGTFGYVAASPFVNRRGNGPLYRRAKGTPLFGLVPVVHRGDPRAAERPLKRLVERRVGGSCGPTGASPGVGSGEGVRRGF